MLHIFFIQGAEKLASRERSREGKLLPDFAGWSINQNAVMYRCMLQAKPEHLDQLMQ